MRRTTWMTTAWSGTTTATTGAGACATTRSCSRGRRPISRRCSTGSSACCLAEPPQLRAPSRARRRRGCCATSTTPPTTRGLGGWEVDYTTFPLGIPTARWPRRGVASTASTTSRCWALGSTCRTSRKASTQKRTTSSSASRGCNPVGWTSLQTTPPSFTASDWMRAISPMCRRVGRIWCGRRGRTSRCMATRRP